MVLLGRNKDFQGDRTPIVSKVILGQISLSPISITTPFSEMKRIP
jgi:hypothetical protein